MGLEHQKYNTQYLENAGAGGAAINDAASQYGVQIVEADVAPGETYWKVIGVHHLTPDENRSNHHVYLEVLDESGQRVTSPIAWVGWTWEGRAPDQRADPAPVDKPANEPGSNVAVFKGQKVSVWMNGLARDASDKSDRVEGIHTEHPDEPMPDGALWNTIGHHSFYVVFQRTQKN